MANFKHSSLSIFLLLSFISFGSDQTSRKEGRKEGNRMDERDRGGRMVGNGNKSAPLYINIVGEELDTSDAAPVVIDGRELKEKSYDQYLDLVDYCFSCLQKSNLQLFTHPGNRVDGGLESHEGEELEKDDYFYRDANFAIDEFNRCRKDVKLKLVKLLKVNTAFWSGINLYMTFSAVDELSGNIGIYQAALLSSTEGNVLGLFRDYSNDKILAILSIIGAEEDLAANKKAFEDDSECYGELVKSDYGVERSECRDLEHFTAALVQATKPCYRLKILLV